ncbi:MAG: PstS family phosphate ABC transporter substrate-binding protein [Ardenticatenaceae bacterium]|nr:PstS family phosphate ABC transporter substrate-binding protein [Ardenticatenaceae bacterium]
MRKTILVLLLVMAVALAACGGSTSEPEVITETVEVTRVVTETQTETVVETVTETIVETVTETVVETVEIVALPAVDPLAVSGDVVAAGSSTVFPLAERMAERFQDEGFDGNITIDSIGSGAGFERFCVAGETDISNASRAIKDSEVESCQAIGREPIEFRVGTDALAVVVSAENDFLTDVTFEQLAAIFSTAETWADVDPSWPAEPILRYIPGTDSGTFDYFVEEIFDENEEPILAASNLELSEDDNVLVQGVLGSPYAIGFFGYAYYAENADTLNILSIEGVSANKENVDNNSYPLARPLFMYTTASIMQEKPQVAAFLNFVLTYVNDEIVDVGYFPASTTALNAAKAAWTFGMTSSGGAEMSSAGIMLPSVDPLAVSGDVVAAGSSTVFPLAERMAERFQDEGFDGNITIDSIGSGAGFERFCVAGETDISNASRAIKDSEVESCQAIGREPIEFRVGTDALAVVVSAENDFLTDVTFEQLAAIFSTAETWADVDPSWPAEPILRYIPGTDSGTFDYFVEEIFDENEEPILAASSLELSEDDNVLVQGVLGSPYAIGFFGYAYYAENADTLNILSIEGVEPNKANVDNNSYPLARPLFMYTTASIMQEKPQVAAFINFVLTYVNDEIVEVGYFPASEDALNLAMLGWLNANN